MSTLNLNPSALRGETSTNWGPSLYITSWYPENPRTVSLTSSIVALQSMKVKLPKSARVVILPAIEGRSTIHLADRREVVSHLENAIAQSSDRILTVSYSMQQDLVRYGCPPGKISVVWNGVDPEKYPRKYERYEIAKIRERYKVPSDWNILLFDGRLTWVKRLRNLLVAMPNILREYPNTKLVILGKGEEQRDIEETAERLGIRDRIVYRFDFVPEYERILHCAAADVCIFPSVYEPFGIVSLEAMAMERPVVVGARGTVGFREQVINSGTEQNGIHINGEDASDIAWGIKEVLSNPDKARNWGENRRKRVLELFTWRKVAEETLKIYESLL